jgi:flagellar biosynthesis protein FlhG
MDATRLSESGGDGRVVGSGNGPRCLAVASGKGGAGKTFVTVNLAVTLHHLGRRVLVIDSDFGLANADILLGLSPERTLQDAVFHGVPIGDVIVHSEHGVDLLPAGSGTREILGFGEARLQVLVEELMHCAAAYDWVLFDCAGGIGGGVIPILASVPRLLVVATPEPTSMVDAYSLLKVVHREGLAHEADLVLNQVASTEEAHHAFDRLLSVVHANLPLALHYLGSIPFSHAVRATIHRRCPLCAGNPDTEASRRLVLIAHALLRREPQPAGLQDADLQCLLKAMLTHK